jgi:hypothetical protein
MVLEDTLDKALDIIKRVSSVKQAHAPSGLQMTAVLDSDSITEILL